MAAAVKKKRRNQSSRRRKSQRNQTRRRKPLSKRGRKTKSRQVRKRTKKPLRKKGPCKRKERQFTKKAKGVLSSCVEGLCRVVSSEADRLRKENCEPQISDNTLLTALEQFMSHKKIRRSVTPCIKKTKKKKQPSVEVTKKIPSPSEQQDAPNQKLPKQRKQASASVPN